jgi:hypothetical protein
MNVLLQAIAAILVISFGLAIGAGLGIATGHPGPLRPWLEKNDLLPHHRAADYWERSQ